MSVPRITKEDLKARLEGDPATLPVILDARLKYPYEHSTLTLPGAVRVNPDDLATSAPARIVLRSDVARDADERGEDPQINIGVLRDAGVIVLDDEG